MTEAMSEKAKEAVIGSIPMKKTGHAEDVAEAAAFLAGASSDYITGQVLCVDGGMAI